MFGLVKYSSHFHARVSNDICCAFQREAKEERESQQAVYELKDKKLC